MNRSKLHLWDFWSAESGLTGLLFFTLAYLFVVCALGDFSIGGLLGRVLFSLVIVAGVLRRSGSDGFGSSSLSWRWAVSPSPGWNISTKPGALPS